VKRRKLILNNEITMVADIKLMSALSIYTRKKFIKINL